MSDINANVYEYHGELIKDTDGNPLYWQEYAPLCFGPNVDWRKVRAFVVLEDEWRPIKDTYYRRIIRAKALSFYLFAWMVHLDRFINKIKYKRISR